MSIVMHVLEHAFSHAFKSWQAVYGGPFELFLVVFKSVAATHVEHVRRRRPRIPETRRLQLRRLPDDKAKSSPASADTIGFSTCDEYSTIATYVYVCNIITCSACVDSLWSG